MKLRRVTEIRTQTHEAVIVRSSSNWAPCPRCGMPTQTATADEAAALSGADNLGDLRNRAVASCAANGRITASFASTLFENTGTDA